MGKYNFFGRVLFSAAIMLVGVQQLLYQNFVPMIFPPWPSPFSGYAVVACLFSVFLIVAGLLMLTNKASTRLLLILGLVFLGADIFGQVPFEYIVVPHKKTHLGVWAMPLKELALAGGFWILAAGRLNHMPSGRFMGALEKAMPLGRYFFCTTMILFGCTHFVYHPATVTLVPRWIPAPDFWAYFTGAALICSGAAIALKIWDHWAALLLGLMIFIWFWLIHLPSAVRSFTAPGGNAVTAALSALAFSGIAFMLSGTPSHHKPPITAATKKEGVLQHE